MFPVGDDKSETVQPPTPLRRPYLTSAPRGPHDDRAAEAGVQALSIGAQKVARNCRAALQRRVSVLLLRLGAPQGPQLLFACPAQSLPLAMARPYSRFLSLHAATDCCPTQGLTRTSFPRAWTLWASLASRATIPSGASLRVTLYGGACSSSFLRCARVVRVPRFLSPFCSAYGTRSF